MEGAASSLSEIKFWQNFLDIEQVFAEPSPGVTSAELASNPFQNTTETNRKRKVSGATRDAAAEKKRLVDKEYRKRCKVRPLFSSLFGFVAENQFNRFVNYNM
ncbi:hypothetical protein OIU76_017588 [Salix suchowensis]|nr:hypothetical protein OIU76_017588 [Salix suchowensis]